MAKTDVANRYIWHKGEIVNVNDAMVNVLSPTSQFGLNVFEGIPCYWNDEEKQLYAFRLDDHYNRLDIAVKCKNPEAIINIYMPVPVNLL